MTGFEPAASCSQSSDTSIVTPVNKQLTNGDVRACTCACTGEAENGQNNMLNGVVEKEPAEPTGSDKNPAEGDMQELIDKLSKLTPEQRKAMLALLDKQG